MKQFAQMLDIKVKDLNSLIHVSTCCGGNVWSEMCMLCGEHTEEVTLDKYYE